MVKEIIDIARRVQAIAQAGLHFAENDFDRERYDELRDLSVSLMLAVSDVSPEKIAGLFTNETGFQTPKVDVRAVVIRDEKILMVREKIDGKYALPGGFADINLSPSQVAVKEVREETGLEVRFNRVMAIIDTDYHSFPPLPYHYYKLIMLCDLIGGEMRDSIETTGADFFAFDQLPPLSEERNTTAMIALVRERLNNHKTYTD